MIPTPKSEQPRELGLTPVSIMVVDTIGTSSMNTIISRKALPKGALPLKLGNTQKVSTLAGTMKTNEMVNLHKLKLPEFDKNHRADKQKALFFDQKCRYDIILGADFLTKSGIDILYSTGTMEWFENVLPMREAHKLNNAEYLTMADAYLMQTEEKDSGEDWLDSYATT